MTNPLFSDIKSKVDQLLIHLAVTTKDFSEPLLDAVTEIKRQYYISTLKDLTKEYPITALKTNSLLYFLDHKNYKLEEMQFGAVPDPLYDAIKAIKNPEKDCPDFVEPPDDFAFETEAEADAFKFAKKMQELKQNRQALLDTDPFYAPKEIEDGLNEPDYPYDTEPSV